MGHRLLRNSRKTEPVAAGLRRVLDLGEGRDGPVPPLRNSRKAECGAKPLLKARAAPFALPRNWLAVLALLASVWLTGAMPARADEDLAGGTILVADRKLKDPHFAQTLVLIVAYTEQGAVGLVLNRPSDVPVSDLLSGVKDARNRKDAAFSGGPVEPMSVLALLHAHEGPRGAQRIAGDIWAILDQDLLADTLSQHKGPDELRFYVGYAGWGPGQLEAEMEAGAWRAVRGNANTVFDTKPETLWDRVFRNLDLFVAKLTKASEPPL